MKSREKLELVEKVGEKRRKVGKSVENFAQNGRRRPFWMTENHFRSYFSPFQINAQLFFLIFVTKWPPAAI